MALSTSGGVVRRYVGARQMSATKPMSLFQQPAPVRLLELRNTYKWGGGPDKTVLLSAARHDPSRVSVVVAYVRDANDHEFKIADKARALRLTLYEIEERSKFDPRVLRAIREIIIKHD